jgi:hypothetical protein
VRLIGGRSLADLLVKPGEDPLAQHHGRSDIALAGQAPYLFQSVHWDPDGIHLGWRTMGSRDPRLGGGAGPLVVRRLILKVVIDAGGCLCAHQVV